MTPEEQKGLDLAIKRLIIEYETALKLKFVENPLAWALNNTWKYFDNRR